MCVCVSVAHHLLDAVKALAVEAEGLLEQHLILHGPLIRKGREVGQVGERALHVVLVPQQHAERLKEHRGTGKSGEREGGGGGGKDQRFIFGLPYLLHVVSVLLLRHQDVLVH